MFRGFPVINSYNHPCRYCKGTARIQHSVEGSHECTSCNGTGIEGSPGQGLLVILAFLLIVILIVVLI